MTPRSQPLARPDPDNQRYTMVDLGERGEHHMRFPMFDHANRIQRWIIERQDPESGGGPLYSGMLLGAFWWHRGMALEAKLPQRADYDAMDVYAAAVLDELQDAGYAMSDIQTLGTHCDDAMAAWIRSLHAAREVADFTQPARPAGSTSRSPASASSAGKTRKRSTSSAKKRVRK